MAAENGKKVSSARLGVYALFAVGALAATAAGIVSRGSDEATETKIAALGAASRVAQAVPEPAKPAIVTPRAAPLPALVDSRSPMPAAAPAPSASSPGNCPRGPISATGPDQSAGAGASSICATGNFIGAGIRNTIAAVMSTALGFCQAFFGHS